MQVPIAPALRFEMMEMEQHPLVKFEIQVPDGGAWIDICNHWGWGATAKKNYLLDVSFTTGGARMSPDPIAGEFSAVIDNPGNIFHPNHPSSGDQGFFRAGRRVRIWLGGNYAAGGPLYWERIYGFMDEPQFSSDTLEVTISGLDYTRRLADMKFTKETSTYLPTPIDNFWGGLHNVPSQATVPPGVELYAPATPPGDAGATFASGFEGNNTAANWAGGAQPATINPVAGVIPPSLWEIKIDVTNIALNHESVVYSNVCNVVAGTQYTCTFRYARTAGTAGGGKHLRVTLFKGGCTTTACILGGSGFLDPPTNYPASGAYETCSFTFTPSAANAGLSDLRIISRFYKNIMTWRVDEISIQATPAPATEVYYAMPTGCTGIYHVILNGVEQWPGKQKGEGWYYDLGANRFWFDKDKIVAAGVGNNLFIYYFTQQQAQNVVADILVKAYPTVYGAWPGSRVAALTAMKGPWPGVGIDRVWFNAGTPYIDAIRMLCERCNYRFYYAFDGTPRFVPTPTPAAAPIFVPFRPRHARSPVVYQSQSEIWNRIVIQGEKLAELTGWEDNMPSELKGEAFDNPSMLNYGTRTMEIKNHLFQNSGDILAMCRTLLALFKNPKWYIDFETPYNAAPMEIGDTIQVDELLDITLADVVHICLIRDMSVSLYDATYNCEIKPP